MILIDFLGLLLFLAVIGGIGIGLHNMYQKEQEKKKPVKYVPPRGPVGAQGGPELHIRTHGLAIFWYEIGRPTKIGTQVEVNMKSGRVGIYELRNVEPAIGTDWSWYDLEFVRYKDSPESPKDGPATASDK